MTTPTTPAPEGEATNPFIVPPFTPGHLKPKPSFFWWSWHPRYPYWSKSCWGGATIDEAWADIAKEMACSMRLYHNKLIREDADGFNEVADVPTKELEVWNRIAGQMGDAGLRSLNEQSEGLRIAAPASQEPAQSPSQGTTGTPEGHGNCPDCKNPMSLVCDPTGANDYLICFACFDNAAAPTPETDAATHDDWTGGAEATDAEVARSLERRLAALQRELESEKQKFAGSVQMGLSYKEECAALQRENATAIDLLRKVERMMDNGTYGDTVELIGPIRKLIGKDC